MPQGSPEVLPPSPPESPADPRCALDPGVERRLTRCGTLPSMSAVAIQVLELAREPDVHLRDLAQILSRDPALAAKVLRMANSPLYGGRRVAQNLRQALNILGLNATITLALSFSLSPAVERSRGGLDVDRFWRRAVASALAARLLGEERKLRSGEELFLAALLQDIGMLALDAAFPGRYAELSAGLTTASSPSGSATLWAPTTRPWGPG